jgi:transcriptional antiterminator NusG
MYWYSLQVYSTHELFVKRAIEKMVLDNKLEEQLGEVLVPTEDVIVYKKGVEEIQEKSLYAGYVFIKANLDINIQHKIQNISKVSGFVGEKGMPARLSENDIKNIVNKVENKAAPRYKTDFTKGEEILIKEGSFENFKGIVQNFDPKTGIINVTVNILGRETPVELEASHITREA